MRKFTINNIKMALAGLALVGVTSSCDVTSLTPADLIPDQEAFGTAARIETAVLGVYESAQRGFYLGSAVNGRGYPFGAANVQQGDMRGEDMNNDQLFYEVTYVGGYNPQTANNNGMWISLYRMINRANIVLENLDVALQNGILTQAQRDNYRAEMLFLRALGHHELVVHFARPFSDPNGRTSPGVPYRTVAINDVPKVPVGEAVGRGTVAEDYTQIMADLNEAETLFTANPNVFRARRGAVIAMKSRVKLHMNDWAGVIEEYQKIRTAYALTDNVAAPFRGVSTDNIFSFQNSAESNPTVNGALASMLGNPANGARGLVKISPQIWRATWWLQEDERRALTSSNATGMYTEKYIDPVTYTDPNPIFRFAEVVLNAAEAYARPGAQQDVATAIELLNSVRSRALPASVPAYTQASFADNTALLTAIFQERRIEFLAEGKRWMDIHRLSGEGLMNGVPLKSTTRSITNINFYTTDRAIPTDHAIPYSSHLFIWPIPLEEILNNNSAPIEQNPGY